jgi:transcription antitermination factor NusG
MEAHLHICDAVQPTQQSTVDNIHWYAIQTRCKHEKKVAQQLIYDGVGVFLPLARVVHRWSDRAKTLDMPLFPTYLFVRTALSPGVRLKILQAGGVLGFVGKNGWGTPIPDKDIEDVKTLVSAKVPCYVYPFLSKGRRVRVTSGCLQGIEGVLVESASERTLVLSVDVIHRSMVIRITDYEVELI